MTDADAQPSPSSDRPEADGTSRFARFRTRPPGGVYLAVEAVACLLLLYSRSFPGSASKATQTGGVLLVVLGVIWVVKLVGLAVARRLGPGVVGLAVPVVLVLATLVLFATAVPLKVRWAASRSAFADRVDAVQAASGKEVLARLAGEQSIGWYDVDRVQRVGLAVIFQERQGDFLGTAGFAYLPDGPTAEVRTAVFQHPSFRALGGRWYAWTDKPK